MCIRDRNLSLLIIHGSIVLVLWPFRLETVRIGSGKILVLLSLANFHSARNRCRDTLRRAKRAFIKRKCANLLGSPTDKSFWPLAKNVSSNFCKSAFPPLIRSDDSVANSPTEKANLFGLLFSSNSTLDDSGIPLPPPSPLRCPMPLPVITFDRVHGSLKSMNVRKAGGPDGIPPRVLMKYALSLIHI